MLSSDPHAWLRPIYRAFTRDGSFPQLAPIVQCQPLVDAAAEISEAKAALLRQNSPAAQSGLFGHLAMMEAQRLLDPSEELWRVRKDGRELVCVAVYMPHGIDLRLLEDDDIRRTRLLRDAPAVEAKAHDWQQMLRASGGCLSDIQLSEKRAVPDRCGEFRVVGHL